MFKFLNSLSDFPRPLSYCFEEEITNINLRHFLKCQLLIHYQTFQGPYCHLKLTARQSLISFMGGISYFGHFYDILLKPKYYEMGQICGLKQAALKRQPQIYMRSQLGGLRWAALDRLPQIDSRRQTVLDGRLQVDGHRKSTLDSRSQIGGFRKAALASSSRACRRNLCFCLAFGLL